MERTGDLVPLHLALAEITTHVPAIAVENVDRPVSASEDDELMPECVDGVRRTVT